MPSTRHSIGQLAAYGLFGLPLAMAALPLYVHLPKFYGDDLGLSLATVGFVLLVTRLLDAISDPLIGYWCDRTAQRAWWMAAAIPLLAVGMLALFFPRATGTGLVVWLTAAVFVTYLGFSIASIAYQAWGAALSDDRHERTRITGVREALALVGVIVAAALPSALGGENALGLGRTAWVFAALIGVCGVLTIALAPRPPVTLASAPERFFVALSVPFANRGFRWLVAVFVPAGIAAAIPSTLVLFFIADVLHAQAWTGAFLVAYFLAAAAGIPCWVWLSGRYGKTSAWLAGMLLAVVAFVWAYGLGAGDVWPFAAICVLSGFALGADLVLPASILADVIDADMIHENAASGRATQRRVRREGSYFGLWNLLTKANLALAAGIALPSLAWMGYSPGAGERLHMLSIAYCLLPCAFKLLAAATLVGASRRIRTLTLRGAAVREFKNGR